MLRCVVRSADTFQTLSITFGLSTEDTKIKIPTKKTDISTITARIDIVDDDVCRSIDPSMTTKRDDIDEKTDDIYELLMMKRQL